MNQASRIQLTDTPQSALIKMADGNPGAINALIQLYQCDADKDSAFGGFGSILSLDTHGIYGTDVYVLWSDICGRDTVKMVAVLRSVQLGLFSESILKDACSRQDRSGKDMVPVDDLYRQVKEQLPNFDN